MEHLLKSLLHLAGLAAVALGLTVLTLAGGLDGSRSEPATASGRAVQDQAPGRRDFVITARRYTFAPARIEAFQDDLIKITLHGNDDIPHSVTIDAYRISKRVGPRQSVVFEFRADQAGSFPFYCNLKNDDGCGNMRGELVVRAR